MSESKSCCPCGKGSGACDAPKPAAAESKKSSKTVQNGKGSAPRNLSAKFRSNFDSIRWEAGPVSRKTGGVVFSKRY
jgi:hypothetical protein